MAYLEADDFPPAELAKLIEGKLDPRVREKFFPPEPDRLFAALGITSPEGQRAAENVAYSFMLMELDILRRDLGVAPDEIIERLKDMTTLGVEHEIRANDEDHAEDVLLVEWHDHTVYEDNFNDDFRFERSTKVAVRMLEVGAGERCIECAEQWLESADFSLLSTATMGS